MELNFHVSLVTGLAKFTAPTSQNIGRELAILGKEERGPGTINNFPASNFLCSRLWQNPSKYLPTCPLN
jgi:hypothetical protein